MITVTGSPTHGLDQQEPGPNRLSQPTALLRDLQGGGGEVGQQGAGRVAAGLAAGQAGGPNSPGEYYAALLPLLAHAHTSWSHSCSHPLRHSGRPQDSDFWPSSPGPDSSGVPTQTPASTGPRYHPPPPPAPLGGAPCRPAAKAGPPSAPPGAGLAAGRVPPRGLHLPDAGRAAAGSPQVPRQPDSSKCQLRPAVCTNCHRASHLLPAHCSSSSIH